MSCTASGMTIGCQAETFDSYLDMGSHQQDGEHVDLLSLDGIADNDDEVRDFLTTALAETLGGQAAVDIMSWVSDRENARSASRDFGEYTVDYGGPMTNGRIEVIADE